MSDNMLHTPTPEFRAQLEQEVLRALRQQERFAGTRVRRARRLRAAALVAACIGLGAASGLASQQVRDIVRRDSILESARAELELIQLRMQLAKANAEEVQAQVRVGAAGPEALAAALAELRTMEARMRRARLNIEEIEATSQPPRDELTAPVSGNRDFVQDRIQLELAAAQERLVVAERRLEEVARRFNAGTETELARAAAELEMVSARAALAILHDRRVLRREYVEKGTDADELVLRHEMTRLRTELEIQTEALRLAEARLVTVRNLFKTGTSTRLEVMRAEVELQERQLALKQLQQRRQRLEQVRREP